MKNKSLYELGILAKAGDDMALLEIIERKKKLIKKYSYGDDDLYQLIILKLISGIKNYKF
ncbi:MAG: helix-turn-helix domain-containing protein [Clostridia bacterium]|nr:helix-turn-helix domain-containing protein [Clostridia bacterium]MBP3801740.1 helix-turn-helix domain-containing protein [Clostridia bacterium]